jgi:hypothetical protein
MPIDWPTLIKCGDMAKEKILTFGSLEYGVDSVIFAKGNEQIMCSGHFLTTISRSYPANAR